MSIRYNGEKIAGKYESQTIYPASESEAGIIKIASSQDVKDGTDNTKAVTPRRLKTNYATKEELNAKQDKLVAGENIKTLNNESLLGEGNIDINSAQWGNIEGDITNQSDLQNELNNKQDIISDIDIIRTNAQTGADLAPQVEVNTQRIEDLTTARIPDVIYHGTPKITGGQVSNFSIVNYLQFPFEDISRGLPFDIYFSFTTDDDVITQQNILDSKFGIALAIQNGKGVMALSSNGVNWDIGSVTGNFTITPNTTYYVKYSWTGTEYKTYISTNNTFDTTDMVLPSNLSPFKTTIYIGGCDQDSISHTPHPFKGIINFNKSKVDVQGITVWEGMADVGIASRANVSLNNLDEVGEKRFTDLQEVINTKQDTLVSGVNIKTLNQESLLGEGNIDITSAQWGNIQGTLSNQTDLQTALDGKLEKTTYEWNKELSLGSTGYVCIGKFCCYDSNITVQINCTTRSTYHATLIIATQNVGAPSSYPYLLAQVHGDVNNTVTPNIYIYKHDDTIIGDGLVEVYFKPESWSKNLIHIQAFGLSQNQGSIVKYPTLYSDILTRVDEIPVEANIKPTNVLKTALDGKQNVITDLATIRTGASKGATALQSVPDTYALKTDIPSNISAFNNDSGYINQIKTINGESIVGSGDVEIKSGGLEIGDIGTALYVDETKGLRRYLNGSIVAINSNTQGFLNWLKNVVTLYSSLVTTEENWQAEKTISKLGQCGKFVIDETAGTIRLPRVINIQGLVDLNNAGVTIPESLPNIKASCAGGSNNDIGFSPSAVQGAFYTTSEVKSKSFQSGSNTQYVLGFDASRSSSTYQDNAPVQEEAIQYPYFIQIATGQETEVDIVNEIELNNPFSLFDSRYSDHELNNLSWLRSNSQWNSGTVYVGAYNLLLKLYNGTETIEGISVKSVGDSTITDYDFVIDTANTQFKLPIKMQGESIYDNGHGYLIEKGEQDGVNYRIYADGYCEQWGFKSSEGVSTATPIIINLVKTYKDTNYQVYRSTQFNTISTASSSIYVTGDLVTTSYPKTVNSFYIGCEKIGLVNGHYWKTNGYLAEGQYSNISYLYYYVGETVQNANLINASRVVEQLSSKQDTLYQTIANVTDGNVILSKYTNIYKITVDNPITITFDTSNISLDNVITFELKLILNNIVDITFPPNINWLDDSIPDMSSVGYYYLVFRTDDGGNSWMANLQFKGV